MTTQGFVVAIDGPTASGKGSIARRLGQIFSLKVLDTGLLYRAVGLAMLDKGLDPTDAAAAQSIASQINLNALQDTRLRSGAAGTAASVVAAHPGVRQALLDSQRAFAAGPTGAILDGRDIGTVICPDAAVKLFVTASLAERAERRWKELQSRGEPITLAAVLTQIAERDARDESRPIAPLRPAQHSILIDTTGLSIDDAVAVARGHIEAARRSPEQ
jgi:cytidylate kinase